LPARWRLGKDWPERRDKQLTLCWKSGRRQKAPGGSSMKKGYRQLLDEANAEIEVVSPEEAASLLEDDGTIFVDLRDPREVERDGQIPGAKHVTRGMLEFWIDPASPYAKPIFQEDKKFVFHCASGWRSALAAKAAQEMGLKPVAHIGGGFTAWREAGGAVEKVEPKKAAGDKSPEQKK
jgi:rhodanese-related sulfurtransferase